MKIMLICVPRSGTSSLTVYVNSVKKNYIVYNEPFRKERVHTTDFFRYDTMITNENIFVKQIHFHLPEEFSDFNIEEIYDRFYNDFDVIVFLDRIDKTKQSESFVHAHATKTWHSRYKFNPNNIEKELTSNDNIFDRFSVDSTIEINKNRFIDLSNELTKTAKKFNKKVFYYEDIYFNKEKMIEFLKELNIEFDENLYNLILDKTNKYRLDLKIDKII
jgi:hypothetical protein